MMYFSLSTHDILNQCSYSVEPQSTMSTGVIVGHINLVAESEKCSRNRFRGNTLLPCGNYFLLSIMVSGVRKTWFPFWHDAFFSYYKNACMGVPPNLPKFRGLGYVSVFRFCYNLPINACTICLITDNLMSLLMIYCTLPWSKLSFLHSRSNIIVITK